MRIQMLPRYTAAAASSRLRVFHLAAEVNRLGLAECTVGPSDAAPDVVFMQKLDGLSLRLNIMQGHKRSLYDFDDIWNPAVLADAATAVQRFTVDTPEHGAMAPGPWEILPDMIDYEPTAPLPPATPFRLCWFGNYPNYASVARLMSAARDFCGTMTICDSLVSDAPNLDWNYRTFPNSLRAAGTALLSHSGADQGKSANKMIAAVTLGVPCIVHESPAYEALARAVGLDWCIVDGPAQLQDAYKRLEGTAERKAYLDAIQPYVWDLYRPEVIARRFMDICESLN